MKARGFSLVEVLVALTVMSIGMMAISGYMANISNQQRILLQKSYSAAIQTNITSLMMATNTHCTGNLQLAHIVFPTGRPPASIPIACPNPPGGCPLTGLSYFKDGLPVATDISTGIQPDGTGLNIVDIKLDNIRWGGPGTDSYVADLVVDYGGSPPLPSSIVPSIPLTASTTGALDTIQSCVQTDCAPGFQAVSPGLEAFCISKNESGGPVYLATAMSRCVAAKAHLCTPREWTEACNYDGFRGPKLDLGNRPDWTDSPHMYHSDNRADDGNMYSVMAAPGSPDFGTCYGFNEYHEWPDSANNGYRCCYRP